jgi:TolB-like protein
MDRLILAGLAAVIVVVAADRFWPRANAPDETPAVGSTTSAPAETAVQQAPDVIKRSIAVLPFVNMSADPEQEYFSDGLSEEILNLLAQIRELKVSGRTSSFSFKGKDTPIPEIGQLLGVAHVLEGSVRKSGDRLRITAQLIETDSGFHLWSETFDREMQDIFVIQTEIAGSIAEALKMSLLGAGQAAPVAQKVASLPAYDLFLQARRLIQGRTRSGLEAARGLLDEALILDPDYAPALAAKAQAVLLLNDGVAAYGDIPLDEAVAIAQPLLDRALTLDPDLAEAHAVQGLLYAEVRRDYLRAEAALTRALALNPSLSDALHWQAGVLGNIGRLREQLAARRRLAEFDPLNVANLSALPWNLLDAGEPAEAEAVALRLQRAFPDNPQGFAAHAGALLNAGRLAEASVPAARALGLAPEGALGRTLNGWLYYALGDFERVLALRTDRLRDPALIALGRTDEAVVVARERSAAAPEDLGAASALLFALSQAGRHDEVLALYRERWADLQGLDAQFGPGESGVQAPIALAQKALGEQTALVETLAHWRARLDFKRQQGHAGRDFQMTEARYLALAGERAAALTALTAAIDLGTRDSRLGQDPAFAELRDDPTFQTQIRRMIELINIERAKLDMAPLP